MNVLAFDACFGAVSVAVRWRSGRGEWLLREAYEARASGQAERLMPLIAEAMEGAGLAFADIDRIAVTIGPGSFTGVRVGVAAARGLALAVRRPVVGMTSLAVMAHRARALLGPALAGRPLAVAADARRGMTYFQEFDAQGRERDSPALLHPAEAAAQLASGAQVVGSAAAAVTAAAAARGITVEATHPDLQPHARFLAMLAPDLKPLDPIKPLYLRAPDAKPQSQASLPRAPS